MDSLKDVGIFIVTGMVALVAYFLRSTKEETDKKIAALFEMNNQTRDNITHIRERIARLEK
jgi:hypothetical protein